MTRGEGVIKTIADVIYGSPLRKEGRKEGAEIRTRTSLAQRVRERRG